MECSNGYEEMEEIVIVGGGICGLATALALHKKGVKSVVLEKSVRLRAAGAAIGVLPNGWRALDQLHVSSHLRTTALPLQGMRLTWMNKGKEHYTPYKNLGEFRCLKRSDLLEALAHALPPNTIRYGCDIVSVETDPLTSLPCLLLSNGKRIATKILIGCDGSRSVVSSFLGLKPPKTFHISSIRGLTSYPNGHSFPLEFVRLTTDRIVVGILPITHNLVHWFISVRQGTDTEFQQDPELIKQTALEAISSGNFQDNVREMIEETDVDSLSFTHLRYRAPWDLMMANFHRGTVAVAGDAMHVMGPFIGQGGSAGIEDAVVLARNLAKKMSGSGFHVEMVGEALNQYVKERRSRVIKLATQSYINGTLAENRSMLTKVLAIMVMLLFFRNQMAHVEYDCGRL